MGDGQRWRPRCLKRGHSHKVERRRGYRRSDVSYAVVFEVLQERSVCRRWLCQFVFKQWHDIDKSAIHSFSASPELHSEIRLKGEVWMS